MGSLYIGCILLCRVAQHLTSKKASNAVTNIGVFVKYSAFRNLISGGLGFLLIFLAGKGFQCDLKTLAISLFSGCMLVLSSGLGLAVLKNGTVALFSMFGTAGLLIPCIAGIFLFHNPMSVGQWLGVALFFVAAYFLISSSSKIYHGFSFKTFLLLMGVLLAEGCTMLSQQMFSYYVKDGNVSVFSFLSFSVLGLALTLFIPFVNRNAKNKTENPAPLSKKLLLIGFIQAVAVFIINQLATLASAMVSPAVLFTFINGGSTIIGSIVAAVFFKEKFTPRSVVGIVLGVTALVAIKVL